MLENNAASFSGRYGHASVVFDNNMWVIGGRDELGRKNDVWFSEEGISWFFTNDTA